MSGNESWLMRPVLHGMCQYESLKNGALDLLDIARMNECLQVKEENERLYRLAKEAENGG